MSFVAYVRTVIGVGLIVSAATAGAAPIPASGPDDICDPADDPCIIDRVYAVQPPGSLSFGARSVHMLPGGRLLGSVGLSCGTLLIDVGANSIAIDSSQAGGVAGEISLNASNTMTINGKLQARGNPGGEITLSAEGDIVVNGRLYADGSPVGSSGGCVLINSYAGSVTTNESIVTQSIKGEDYDSPTGGCVYINADVDIVVNGPLLTGGGSGGIFQADAYGSVTVSNDVIVSAGVNLSYGGGGYVYIYGDTGINITGSGPTQTSGSTIAANATTGFTVSAYGYKYPHPGYGGLHMLRSTYYGDISVARQVSMSANGGPNAGGYGSTGGWLFLYSYGGKVVMDGSFTAKGSGRYGYGGYAFFTAYSGIEMGPASSVNLRSKTGGYMRLLADYEYSDLRLDGTLDVRGNNKVGNGDYSNYGSGGYINIEAGNAVVGGKMLQGADGNGSSIGMRLCRLRALDGAKIDASHGSPLGGGSVYIDVQESFIAEQGSRIFADAQGGGSVDIGYRSGKSPVLGGTIEPDPLLSGSPGGGCPVCGNDEIDADESCDDGNTVSGDGCNDECQDEGCIAATSGYPATPLCSDGDACTIDTCDPTTSACSNLLSCEEGVACTVDACVAGACEHTPNDLLCDDYNDCTEDLCNPATGCAYADLTGPACEDGDLCTVTGTCDAGACVATDEVRTNKNAMKFKFSTDPDRDKAGYKGELPLADYTANPTLTGMTVELRDSNNLTMLSAQIPDTSFQDRDGTGDKVRFRDKDHLLPTGAGIKQISIKRIPAKGVAKVKIKIDDTDLSAADGEFRLSLSMLFGADPAVDDCLTARFIPCDPKTGKNKCKDPK